MQIRPATPADAGPVAELIDAAFGDEGATVAAVWRDVVAQLVDVLVLSPLSVQPDRQHGGIGTALLAAAVDAARALGAPALFLEGDPGYYGSRGFDRASTVSKPRPGVLLIRPSGSSCSTPTSPG